MNRIIEKVKQIIQKILGKTGQKEENIPIKNIILYDISNIELNDVESQEGIDTEYKNMDIKKMQFGKNNRIRGIRKEDEALKKGQEKRANNSKEFRDGYSLKEDTTIRVGNNMTINFKKGVTIKNCEFGQGIIREDNSR